MTNEETEWSLAERLQRQDEIDARINQWAADKSPTDAADTLQAEKIEAVPVQNFPQTFDDPQLAARNHFDWHTHCAFGDFPYEHNGFRLSNATSNYTRPAPALGAHYGEVLSGLGYQRSEIDELVKSGAVEG